LPRRRGQKPAPLSTLACTRPLPSKTTCLSLMLTGCKVAHLPTVPCERLTWRDGARFAKVRDAGARFFGLGFEIFHCHTSGSKIRLSSLALPPSVSEFASQSCDPHKNPLRVFIETAFHSTEGGRKEETIPATRPPVTCSPPRLSAGPRRPDRVLARCAARDIRRPQGHGAALFPVRHRFESNFPEGYENKPPHFHVRVMPEAVRQARATRRTARVSLREAFLMATKLL
jgi:hypothetical protein